MSALTPVEQNDQPQPRMTERELASALICANNGFPEVVDKIGVERSREYSPQRGASNHATLAGSGCQREGHASYKEAGTRLTTEPPFGAAFV